MSLGGRPQPPWCHPAPSGGVLPPFAGGSRHGLRRVRGVGMNERTKARGFLQARLGRIATGIGSGRSVVVVTAIVRPSPAAARMVRATSTT